MKAKLRTAVLALAALVVFGGVLAGLLLLVGRSGSEGAAAKKGKKAPSVRTELVRRASLSRTLELTGEVVTVNSVVIAVTVEGPINFCPWREGDQVKSGAKLIEIDRQTYRAEVQAAEAALAVETAELADMKAGTRPEQIAESEQEVREAEEMLSRAKLQFDRAQQLIEPGGVSREDYESSQTEHRMAQAKLAASEAHLEMLKSGSTATQIAVQEACVQQAAAAVELARARLAECFVMAPFDGTIAAVHVRVGDVATAKAPLLEIIDPSSMVLRFAVPEAHVASIRPDTPVTVMLDAYPGQSHRAAVVRVYPTLDTTMRTRTVEAEFTEPVDLVPGMFARLVVHVEIANDVVVVPQEAILITPTGRKRLFVVRGGKAVQRQVTTGIEQARMVQVFEGVEPGEQVVVAGNEKLKDGMPVSLPGKNTASSPGKKSAKVDSAGKPRSTVAQPAGAGGPST